MKGRKMKVHGNALYRGNHNAREEAACTDRMRLVRLLKHSISVGEEYAINIRLLQRLASPSWGRMFIPCPVCYGQLAAPICVSRVRLRT